MPAVYPQKVDMRKTTIGGLLPRLRFGMHHAMSASDFPYTAIGYRLEAIRTGFSDMSQKAWAEKHGFNPTQYNNWAKGARRIPVDAAEKLCETYGLTLDAIYRGRMDGLSDTVLKIF